MRKNTFGEPTKKWNSYHFLFKMTGQFEMFASAQAHTDEKEHELTLSGFLF